MVMPPPAMMANRRRSVRTAQARSVEPISARSGRPQR
jgi:hypothetical protein